MEYTCVNRLAVHRPYDIVVVFHIRIRMSEACVIPEELSNLIMTNVTRVYVSCSTFFFF